MAGKGIFAWVCPCVDSFAFVEDSYLEAKGWKKASLVLLEQADAIALTKELNFDKEVSGGICMNISRALGVLGYPTTVIGQNGDDPRGKIVEDSVVSCGVTNRMIVKPNTPTSNVLLLVTPDAQRTIILIDGASDVPFVEKVEPSIIDDYDLVLTDVFQIVKCPVGPLITESLIRGKQLGKKTALILSNIMHVPGTSEKVHEFLHNVSILSGTLDEHMALFNKSTKEELVAHLEKSHFELCAVTMGPEGSYIFVNGKSYHFPAPDVANVIDTTGAGDSFAAGLLYSYLNGFPIETIGQVASAVAGYTIARVGIVLEPDLREHVKPYLPK